MGTLTNKQFSTFCLADMIQSSDDIKLFDPTKYRMIIV